MEILIIALVVLLLARGGLTGILTPAYGGTTQVPTTSATGLVSGVGANNSVGVNSPYTTPITQNTGLVGVSTGVGQSIIPSLFTAGASVGAAAASAPASFAALGLTGAAAGAAVAGIGAVAAIGVLLWQQHEARLKGATTENQAVDQYVPVFDSFVSKLVTAYNSQQISAQDAALTAQAFDRSLYSAFRGFVGQPGTAWSDSVGMAGQCDKSCTVGCCVYFGDLGPVLNNISYVLGYPTGKWGAGDPRISGRTIQVPTVYSSKYSSYSRPGYSISLA